jgi:flagellar biosynthesis/type III secretory pathway ATPase
VLTVPAGRVLLGRVIDGLGQPMDGLGPIAAASHAPLRPPAMNPMDREPVTVPIGTGVRAIDGLLTCGRGQRIGVFGGSGVGKSTLLGMMARGTEADVVVLGLIGERGREVRSFLEHDLGQDGLARSVVVVSTSDSPPLARLRAAYAATSIAESFRDEGMNVLLMMDSDHALLPWHSARSAWPPASRRRRRDIRRPCSASCPGCSSAQAACAIPAAFTGVLHRCSSKADDHNEPYRRRRARHPGRPHRACRASWRRATTIPAIDILPSVSRTMPQVTSVEHRVQAGQVREWLATVRDNEDLVSVGRVCAGIECTD